eukprot:1137930-Rhodomonas_salina.1
MCCTRVRRAGRRGEVEEVCAPRTCFSLGVLVLFFVALKTARSSGAYSVPATVSSSSSRSAMTPALRLI